MNTVFRLVNPIYDMDKYIFNVTVFINGLKLNIIPYSMLLSAYSTCRVT